MKILKVDDKAIEVQNPVYAQATRDRIKAEEIKDENTKIAKAEEHKEKVEAPKMNEGAKKMYLSESLFEDFEDYASEEEPSDYLVKVYVGGESEIESGDEVDIETEFAEIRDMSDEELLDNDLWGAALIYKDDEGMVHVEEIMFVSGKEELIDQIAHSYTETK